MSDTLLTISEIAPLAGLTEKSARTYHEQAARRRREGLTRPRDMPEPDRRIGRIPVWERATIDRWLAERAEASRGK